MTWSRFQSCTPTSLSQRRERDSCSYRPLYSRKRSPTARSCLSPPDLLPVSCHTLDRPFSRSVCRISWLWWFWRAWARSGGLGDVHIAREDCRSRECGAGEGGEGLLGALFARQMRRLVWCGTRRKDNDAMMLFVRCRAWKMAREVFCVRRGGGVGALEEQSRPPSLRLLVEPPTLGRRLHGTVTTYNHTSTLGYMVLTFSFSAY